MIFMDISYWMYFNYPDNWESIIVIEYINEIDGNILLILIVARIQQLALWFNNKLSNNIVITITKTEYTNN